MRYTVYWRPQAEQELGELWLNGPDRQEIAQASDAIDALIAEVPFEVGESRIGNTRVIFSGPLIATYDVLERDLLVVVLSIWRSRRP